MPVAKIHLLEGEYTEAWLDKVSNAIEEALVGSLLHPHHGGNLASGCPESILVDS